MTSLRVAWTMLGLASFPGSSCAVEEAGNEAMLGQRNNYLFNGAEVQESRAIPVPLKQHPYRLQVIQLFTSAKKTFFSEDHNHQLSKGTNNGWVHLRTSVNVIQRVMRSAWLITLLSEKKTTSLLYLCVIGSEFQPVSRKNISSVVDQLHCKLDSSDEGSPIQALRERVRSVRGDATHKHGQGESAVTGAVGCLRHHICRDTLEEDG